jgi:hypothetical protein
VWRLTAFRNCPRLCLNRALQPESVLTIIRSPQHGLHPPNPERRSGISCFSETGSCRGAGVRTVRGALLGGSRHGDARSGSVALLW